MRRTCDELGVCQGSGCKSCDAPAIKATGDFYPKPIMDDADQPLSDRRAKAVYLGVVLLVVFITMLSLLGTAGYLAFAHNKPSAINGCPLISANSITTKTS